MRAKRASSPAPAPAAEPVIVPCADCGHAAVAMTPPVLPPHVIAIIRSMVGALGVKGFEPEKGGLFGLGASQFAKIFRVQCSGCFHRARALEADPRQLTLLAGGSDNGR